ncbi:recombinase RecA [Candidatus Uhrbacteria bacterium]|nr:recombinase RecA [Candidatus Uhrbacteria bacterium]
MSKTHQEEPNEKARAAIAAILQIRERFGDGSIMKLGEAKKMQVETISTGSVSLDFALGVGGLPRGRVIEIFGPEMSGKSTLALHTVAEVQNLGGLAAYIDAEHALDPEYAGHIGVKTQDLLISQPDTGEQALEIVETLVRSNAVDLVVVDSVAALVPRAEIEGDMGDLHPGLQARLMSQALRKLTGVISKSKTVVIFINQIRHKIGIMFGNPETTTGGLALKFYSSVRIEVRRAAQIKQGEKIVGNRVKIKIVKNKVAPPFRACEFDIMYNEGISKSGDLLDTAVLTNVIAKSGNSYSFGDEKLGVGREAARQTLASNPSLMSTVRSRILETTDKQDQALVADIASESE